ncbi:DUF3027 domain-containing protein [Arthrobacter oryzae]|jgi:hypothetical protein|uniref:DUF3027 domain-containing protein n=1 Tax=Arthrobacter oryzae TaxID=409290 RepID=UPI00285FBE02|nr:DUF3027 domain-containing protein [Arthrobacter oryzae]MDR6507063.1 hypothetical protein [Arthrobacter oryzae]
MTSEPEQSAPKPASKPRAGVPVWRTGKPDAVLAAAVDFARTAVEGIAPAAQIGRHLGAKTEGDRVVTHLFESKLAGYQGWQWYAVLTRNSRSKVITVNELGLLPSEDSILAPEWVPWAERVRPEDAQEDEIADAEIADVDTEDADAAVDAIAVDAADDAAADDTSPDLPADVPVSDDEPKADTGHTLREAD